MAAIFQLPRGTLLDAGGIIIPGGTVNFYNAGTTTPQTVYSDSGLSTPLSQPVAADSAGRLPAIYLTTGSFKIIVKDASGNTLYTNDNLDSGVAASSGAIFAALPAFFAATTQAGARSAIGAGAASDVTTLSSAVSAIQAQITAVGGTLGALAGLATLDRAHLASGFGFVPIQRAVVDSSATYSTISTTTPFDDSIPQNTEGGQVLSGSFTPLSASSVLDIEVDLWATVGTSGHNIGVGIFQNTTANAIKAGFFWGANNAGMSNVRVSHRLSSPGTSAITFAVRAGADTGNLYINGTSSNRIGGGSLLTSLRVTETLQF